MASIAIASLLSAILGVRVDCHNLPSGAFAGS
jgi:hypothetical protein